MIENHMVSNDILDDIQPHQERHKRFGNNTISLSKASVFSFGPGFRATYGLDKYKFVILHYGKKYQIISFQFLNDDKAPGAYKITVDGNSKSISSSSFIKKNHIDLEKYSGRYEPKEGKHPKYGTMYYISLNEKINESS